MTGDGTSSWVDGPDTAPNTGLTGRTAPGTFTCLFLLAAVPAVVALLIVAAVTLLAAFAVPFWCLVWFYLGRDHIGPGLDRLPRRH